MIVLHIVACIQWKQFEQNKVLRNIIYKKYSNGQRKVAWAVAKFQVKISTCKENQSVVISLSLDTTSTWEQALKKRGDRLVTENICAMCFSFENRMSADEIKKNRDIGRKNRCLFAAIISKYVWKYLHQVVQAASAKRNNKECCKIKKIEASLNSRRRKKRKITCT